MAVSLRHHPLSVRWYPVAVPVERSPAVLRSIELGAFAVVQKALTG